MNRDSCVWLIDSSMLIHIKHVIPGSKQWTLFRLLESMVEEARIAYPKQVRIEMTQLAHPDAPGVWAEGVFPAIKHPVSPDVVYMRQVMASPAARVVDPNKTKEDADPYLIALALQLMASGLEVCVVTEDHLDTGVRIALTSACDICKVPWMRAEEFLTLIGYAPVPR